MKRIIVAPVLLGGALTLGGCLPMLAMQAASMAVGSGQRNAESNAYLAPTAEAACSAQAAQYGLVQVIDVQQATPSKIIVWGTAGEGAARRSFECHFGNKITDFKLRAIKPMP